MIWASTCCRAAIAPSICLPAASMAAIWACCESIWPLRRLSVAASTRVSSAILPISAASLASILSSRSTRSTRSVNETEPSTYAVVFGVSAL